MATTTKKPLRATTMPQERTQIAADTVVAPRPENAVQDDDFLDPERRDAHERGDRQADPAMQPFLGAARSHLDKPANPKPTWPSVQGLYGTGAISALARLDEAMDARSRKQAEDVDAMRLPAEVGQYKQAVLEWLAQEGA